MGKHKDKKSKKLKKSKHKKEKKRKRKYSSSSSSTSSGSEEWVEKVQEYSSDSDAHTPKKIKRSSSTSDSDSSIESQEKAQGNQQKVAGHREEQEEWSAFSKTLSSSNQDRRSRREEEKRLEREKQLYDPRSCVRELNPYWKDGGDGLPKFRKPTDNDEEEKSYERERTTPNWRKSSGSRESSWRKNHHNKQNDEGNRLNSRIDSSASRNENVVKSSEKKEIEEPRSNEEMEIPTDKQLNILASRLVKAEIMGNTKLAEELKLKLEEARKLKAEHPKLEEESVILTQTDSKGISRPVRLQSDFYGPSTSREKKQKVETHKDGQRVRYFADDDKYSLKQMFENEKYTSVEDQNRDFLKMAGKLKKDDLDEVFEDKIRHKESDSKVDRRNRDKAIGEHQSITKSLDNCSHCIQANNTLKNLMISIGGTIYLSLSPIEPLTEHHCLLSPIRHVTCGTQLDENEWSDLLDFRKALTKLFASLDQDVIFFELAVNLHRFPHMILECIPVPREQGDLAPIYFKKAIDESEYEWSQNKKLISLKGRDVRKAVPKGLPYFFVSFGMEEGFAHVIEEEKYFPKNFAQEIIGGMLDLHHSKWRNPKRQSFDDQSKRVLGFSKLWRKFDITARTE